MNKIKITIVMLIVSLCVFVLFAACNTIGEKTEAIDESTSGAIIPGETSPSAGEANAPANRCQTCDRAPRSCTCVNAINWPQEIPGTSQALVLNAHWGPHNANIELHHSFNGNRTALVLHLTNTTQRNAIYQAINRGEITWIFTIDNVLYKVNNIENLGAWIGFDLSTATHINGTGWTFQSRNYNVTVRAYDNNGNIVYHATNVSLSPTLNPPGWGNSG